MKRIRIGSAIILGLLMFGVTAQGQETKDKNGPSKTSPTNAGSQTDSKASDAEKKKPEEPMTKVKGYLPANWKQLGLTDDQKQEIYKRQAYHRAKVKMLEAEIEKIKSEERTSLEAVLTDLQKKRLREILLEKAPKPE
ncbi:unnamed protein product [Tuwongella immobilis]|uniref:Uncharacterized protein n=2 Tax=Tuwongella immobilis TaxID=692036 RepID=A0A6C2YPP5_9BACT|nr:unnamed protein product [Tuwongella immobilis]VTS03397.1 unnamed protein product [Tuwongella immobilis]